MKYFGLRALILFTFFGLSFLKLSATHYAGGQLTYECLGGNQYRVTLKYYRDCSGTTMPSTTTLTATSSCGNSSTVLQRLSFTEVSQLCAADSANSTCNGGNLPGMQEYIYQGVITLAPCADWNLSSTVSQRNTSTNFPNSINEDYYISATLNNVLASCNNSPDFTSQPIPYFCVGQPVNYNWGVVELDGDSLVYDFICPRYTVNSPLVATSPYSCNEPLVGITLDHFTGQITFTPITMGKFIVVVRVTEYNSAGQIIGTVMRDIQFVIQNCTNIVPEDTAGTIQNLHAPAMLLGPYSAQLCEGDTLEFDAQYNDIDGADILSIITNMSIVLPGSNYSVTGINPIVVHYSWVAPGGSAGLNTSFSVTVNDGACPIPGLQTFIYDIAVSPATLAGPDHIICGPKSQLPGQAHLYASGGTSFTWTSISGDPIIIGTNFSCATCDTVIATPSVTTTYVVQVI